MNQFGLFEQVAVLCNIKRPRLVVLVAAAVSATAVAGPPVVASPDYDETFSPRHIRIGAPAKTSAKCDATPNAVWVRAQWLDKGVFGDSIDTTTECIRYFPSDDALGAQTAIFYFSGDIVLSGGAGDGTRDPGYSANSYKEQINSANRLAKRYGVPFIHVARPGMYGSTGNTATHRHSNKEAAIMNAAVDAIKAALGYQRISVVGQSGGGGIVGVLLTSGRTDLDCVAIASGSVSIKTNLRTAQSKTWVRPGQDTTGLPYRQLYDSIDHLGEVKPDAKRRVFMLADPEDIACSYESQQEFAQSASQLGVAIKFISAKGRGSQHHSTAAQAIRLTARCVAGMDDPEIAAWVEYDAGIGGQP